MSKPLTIQYTGKYANHLLREKEKEIERLHSIIKEVRESAKNKIKQYESYIHDLKIGNFSEETKHKEKIELIFRIREQEELLEILDKADKGE